MRGTNGPTDNSHHDDDYVRELFDKMGPTYGLMNVITSFGFSEWWRYACVKLAGIKTGDTVCDMMAGSGECWRYLKNRDSKILSVDFSTFMVEQQHERNHKFNEAVEIKCESALATSIESNSVDVVVCAFGLKTLSDDAVHQFAREISRILKPGGKFSLLEISVPQSPLLKGPYGWYLQKMIPLFGKIFLHDFECYRMLGIYTSEFGSCARVSDHFNTAGLDTTVANHFFGCASSLSGHKPLS